MAPFRLRGATVRDLDLLVRHRRGMWEEIADFLRDELDAADAAYRRWARPRLRNGGLVGFVAETAAGVPAASACLWVMPSQPRPGWKGTRVPYLLSMFTEPEFRRRGLATRILRASIRWARDRGYDHVLLHASVFGEPLYREWGFERSAEMRLVLPRRLPRSRGPSAGQ